ncbi:MAG: hypothetical protein HY017_22895 [Betaproteobacteria bacterium]|nr:hypothetical protein [Betaproteobacteria bacterium]
MKILYVQNKADAELRYLPIVMTSAIEHMASVVRRNNPLRDQTRNATRGGDPDREFRGCRVPCNA